MIRLGPWGRCSMRTVAHSNACRFRSSRLAKLRPGKKFVSTVQKLRSSPALRLACPFSWQTNRKPCAVAKAAISGTITAFRPVPLRRDRKSTRLNSSHGYISYAVFCLKKKKTTEQQINHTSDPTHREHYLLNHIQHQATHA